MESGESDYQWNPPPSDGSWDRAEAGRRRFGDPVRADPISLEKQRQASQSSVFSAAYGKPGGEIPVPGPKGGSVCECCQQPVGSATEHLIKDMILGGRDIGVYTCQLAGTDQPEFGLVQKPAKSDCCPVCGDRVLFPEQHYSNLNTNWICQRPDQEVDLATLPRADVDSGFDVQDLPPCKPQRFMPILDESTLAEQCRQIEDDVIMEAVIERATALLACPNCGELVQEEQEHYRSDAQSWACNPPVAGTGYARVSPPFLVYGDQDWSENPLLGYKGVELPGTPRIHPGLTLPPISAFGGPLETTDLVAGVSRPRPSWTCQNCLETTTRPDEHLIKTETSPFLGWSCDEVSHSSHLLRLTALDGDTPPEAFEKAARSSAPYFSAVEAGEGPGVPIGKPREAPLVERGPTEWTCGNCWESTDGPTDHLVQLSPPTWTCRQRTGKEFDAVVNKALGFVECPNCGEQDDPGAHWFGNTWRGKWRCEALCQYPNGRLKLAAGLARCGCSFHRRQRQIGYSWAAVMFLMAGGAVWWGFSGDRGPAALLGFMGAALMVFSGVALIKATRRQHRK